MRRRRYLGTIGAVLGSVSSAGCMGLAPLGHGNESPEYPGGTLVVENTDQAAVDVSVTASPEEYDASLDTTVGDGEILVRREFVTAERGDVVTLAAQLREEGVPIEFQFLPAGGDGDSPPEVARLTVKNAVEASATWTATKGN
ncbi:hypothetical protein [Halapricum desulfuricans]|nr:hypothetical protein [Halapricum desulfuricans]